MYKKREASVRLHWKPSTLQSIYPGFTVISLNSQVAKVVLRFLNFFHLCFLFMMKQSLRSQKNVSPPSDVIKFKCRRTHAKMLFTETYIWLNTENQLKKSFD